MKKHLVIASSIVVASWVSSGVYVFLGLRKIREETKKDEAASNKAKEIMLERIRNGMYVERPDEDIAQDYHFFKIAERLDE